MSRVFIANSEEEKEVIEEVESCKEEESSSEKVESSKEEDKISQDECLKSCEAVRKQEKSRRKSRKGKDGRNAPVLEVINIFWQDGRMADVHQKTRDVKEGMRLYQRGEFDTAAALFWSDIQQLSDRLEATGLTTHLINPTEKMPAVT